jgi:hypothetical protein
MHEQNALHWLRHACHDALFEPRTSHHGMLHPEERDETQVNEGRDGGMIMRGRAIDGGQWPPSQYVSRFGWSLRSKARLPVREVALARPAKIDAMAGWLVVDARVALGRCLLVSGGAGFHPRPSGQGWRRRIERSCPLRDTGSQTFLPRYEPRPLCPLRTNLCLS